MPGDLKSHWTQVYRRAAPHEVSWFEAVPERSLELILATGVAKDAPILDVGGGASTLVDYLLREGFKDLTVLDLAAPALAAARARLGPAAARVEWIETDATAFRPPRPYALWHDRAVFHFLTDPAERERYLEVLRAALTPGGHAVLATFGPKGPTRCSGLEVERYSADRLCGLLGLGFRLQRSLLADHVTPAGVRQQFLYGWWQSVNRSPVIGRPIADSR